ncbi:MAG: non-canonical purine NTP pyrophosphatase, RdgB/HAM1 family [Chloroflexi bacterium RBG_13_54_9]|nr:MAG: non-canonical purine NTP pyrophosphatase, RdgB/HAM1 family [Chloroflexi bacterium RBG_13_54_9]
MPKLLLATSNRAKAKEYCTLLAGLPFELTTLDGAGIKVLVSETGATYAENATLKAITYANLSQLISLADDSGLEVEALGGEPGPRAARYAGEGASDESRIKYLLSKLVNVPWDKRGAHFKCVIAIATPEGMVELCYGECEGIITFEPRGENGFGYDPIFYLPERGKTMAELSSEEKNRISHRAQAARKAHQVLEGLSGGASQ